MVTIKKSNEKKQTTCSNCFSIIWYDVVNDPICDDIRYDSKLKVGIYSWHICCPQCHKRIKVIEKYSKHF
jgi:ssDNA-binding Zn-finger/Zn-ribbon topoisomerase 1